MRIFDVTIRVKVLRGDAGEHLAGIKEDTAALIEAKGAGIVGITTREVALQPPKQLSIRDVPAPAPAAPDEKPKKQKKERMAPNVPTLEQVLAYAAERRALRKGMTDEAAESWYDDCCTKKWHYGKDMTPVLDWKSHFRTGERHRAQWDREAAARTAKTKTTGYETSFNLPEWEKSTLEVPVFQSNDAP